MGNENFAQQVADRIRELREQRGWSVRELARRAGLPPESISRSERGITQITLTTLAKVFEALGIDVLEFFAFTRREPLARLSPELRRVAKVFARLDEDAVGRAVRAIEVLYPVAKAAPTGRKPKS